MRRPCLDCACDDQSWASDCGIGLSERLVHLLHVVSVDIDDVPSESTPFGVYVAERFHGVNGAVKLNAVGVENGAHVIQIVVGGRHCGLPHLTLLNLTIAEHDVVTRVQQVVLRRQRCPIGQRQSLTQRTG